MNVLGKRWVLTALILAFVGGVVGLVILSPVVMGWVASRTADWSMLSDVGQAYGGISAILSALAFCGISISIYLQWRQIRATDRFAAGQRHFELVKLGIEDPHLAIVPSILSAVGSDQLKRIQYITAWLSHWSTMWDLRLIEEGELRRIVSEMFDNEDAQEYWRLRSDAWPSTKVGRWRSFHAIVSEEYMRSLTREIADQSDANSRPTRL